MVRKKIKKKQLLLGTLVILVTLGIIFMYLWHQVEIIRIGYQTRKLEQKVQVLAKEVEKLEAKRSELLSLKKVELTARERLNLTDTRDDQIIYDDILKARKETGK